MKHEQRGNQAKRQVSLSAAIMLGLSTVTPVVLAPQAGAIANDYTGTYEIGGETYDVVNGVLQSKNGDSSNNSAEACDLEWFISAANDPFLTIENYRGGGPLSWSVNGFLYQVGAPGSDSNGTQVSSQMQHWANSKTMYARIPLSTGEDLFDLKLEFTASETYKIEPRLATDAQQGVLFVQGYKPLDASGEPYKVPRHIVEGPEADFYNWQVSTVHVNEPKAELTLDFLPARSFTLAQFSLNSPDNGPLNLDKVRPITSAKITANRLCYEPVRVQQGDTITSESPRKGGQPLDLAAIPAIFTKIDGTPDWVESVSPTGEVTVKPGFDIPAGEYTIPIGITYTNRGVTSKLRLNVEVTPAPFVTKYEPTDAPWNTKVTIPPTAKEPEGTRYALSEQDAQQYPWIRINKNSGELTVTAPSSENPGPREITVLVTHPDEETHSVKATITVTNPYVPQDQTIQVVQGSDNAVSSKKPTSVDDESLPDGSRFALNDPAQLKDWMTFDEATGVITAKPGFTVPEGSYPVAVTVTYPDGKTTQQFTVTVEVEKATLTPTYEDVNVRQGEKKTGNAPTDGSGNRLPDGTTFAKGDGWPSWADIDTTTGAITVRPGYNVEPTDSPVELPVVVTYPDGTQATTIAKVSVIDNKAPTYESAKVQQGGNATIPAPTGENGQPLAPGTTFTPAKDLPSWITVNSDGSINVTPGYDVPTNTYPVKITVTVPGEAPRTITSTVTVTPFDKGFVYETGKGTPGSKVTISTPENPAKVTPPAGSTYAKDETADIPEWVTVNSDGSITAQVPGGFTGDVKVPVVVTYPDGSQDTITATITITANPGPSVDSGEVKQGGELTIPAPKVDGGGSLPDGTIFAPAEDLPGWITVNDDGSITAKPGFDVPVGDYPVKITVTVPGEAPRTITSTVTVTPFDKGFVYETGKGTPGSEVTISTPTNPAKVTPPAGSTYAKDETADIPEWVTVNSDGSITAQVPGGFTGDVKVPVVVTYPDGSQDTITATITITAPEASVVNPDWNDASTPAGKPVDLPNDGGKVVPGTSVTVPSKNGSAELDPDTGVITVTPDGDAKPGDKVVVVVTDSDGKIIDTVTVTVSGDGVVKPKPDAEGTDGSSASSGKNSSDSGSSLLPLAVIPLLAIPAVATLLPALSSAAPTAPAVAPAPVDVAPEPAPSDVVKDPAVDRAHHGQQPVLAVTGVGGLDYLLSLAAMAFAAGAALLFGGRRRKRN
ncbi:Rib/alpha-like domain-containing protein [Corynebacterium choanae]|uniref:C protein alpha-antigen n=1 Tax=Corynebacterium choanae TaxID=1862358 RepID=A0A3G6JEC6_9CORY|nr:Rib/alpha-like domain-containing protein [Corynebacterium choanae]AZA14494.1 C protein alpha-antigen precursor [Corynebacterium choanae]